MVRTILPFLTGAVLTAALTPLLIRLARQHRIYDHPGGRRVHRKETPRLGGVAMLLSVLFGGVAAMLAGGYFFRGRFTLALMAGYGPILVVSLWDDVRSLPWWIRFPAQLIGAVVFVVLVGPMQRLNLPLLGTFSLGYWGYVLSVAWLLLTVNAMNFIDGVDGLAAGIGAIAAAVLALALARTSNVPAMALAAAVSGVCIGFLPWNFPSARIFMGDSGATLIGFSLGAVSLVGAGKNVALVSMIVPMLALAVPILDAIRVLLHRSWRRTGLFTADRAHVHHILLSSRLGARGTVLLLCLFSAMLGGIALLLSHAPRLVFVVPGLLVLVFVVLLWWHDLRSD